MVEAHFSPKARGKRVRAVRERLRLSRPALQRKYGIKADTLQVWEDGRKGGLSEKGAKQLVKCFTAEGVPCTLEWLLYGIGDDPLPAKFPLTPAIAAPAALTVPSIAQELQFFYQAYPDGVDVIISDDCMAPCFLPGDHVAGRRYFGKDIVHALNTCCIVHTQASGVIVRVLTAGSRADCYTLTCLNPHTTTVNPPALTNVVVFSATPITWFRRPD